MEYRGWSQLEVAERRQSSGKPQISFYQETKNKMVGIAHPTKTCVS